MQDEAQGPVDDFSRAIAHAIEDAKDAAGLTTRDLLKRSGLSSNYYYRRARLELPFTTNDMSALAAACGMTVADLWARAQAELAPREEQPSDVIAARARKLLAVAHAQFPTIDIPSALTASEAARAARLSEDVWEAILSGNHDDVSDDQLAAAASFFGVDAEYLTQVELSPIIDAADARLDVQEAFAQSDARGVSSRSVAGASPASLRALARAIRESHRRTE